MREILIVIKREFLSRVVKKTFVLTTLLFPFLLAIIVLLPLWISKPYKQLDHQNTKFGLVNRTNIKTSAFSAFKFDVNELKCLNIDSVESYMALNKFDVIIDVSKADSTKINLAIYQNVPYRNLVNEVKSVVRNVLIDEQLQMYGVKSIDDIMNEVESSINVDNVVINKDNGQYKQSICMLLGIIIYLLIFIFSSQTLRGVVEEKSNRIVEIIITSISPVKFMFGKILGIALLGLTQILCWATLFFVCFILMSTFIDNPIGSNVLESYVFGRVNYQEISTLLENASQINFEIILPFFIMFFLGGYFLYSSMFAAVGATATHSDDVQQMTSLVTLPLILAFIILTETVKDPNGALSYWFSYIPFTSPVVMTGRIVYGVPFYEVIISLFILILSTVVVAWTSGKIYRIGVLYTGKKVSLKNMLLRIVGINN